MRSVTSVLGLVALGVACFACSSGSQRPAREVQTVIIPESIVRPASAPTQLAPVARGTIRLGTVDTVRTLEPSPAAGAPAGGAAAGPPTAVGGGPPATTSVGPMSPTTVTGADSPLDNAPTAPPAGGGPGNPLTTGSATTGGGPANAPTTPR
ncbi:MAG: hypothetical protein HYV09_34190 [Deltaproteobacteria bacterium]|nr:hypothetical protein [Deltaproteobacteria bacterium]